MRRRPQANRLVCSIVAVATTAMVAGFGDPAAATTAMLQTYRIGIDVGNDPATGCDFDLMSVAPHVLPGFELQLTVVVDADQMPPQVVLAEVETCNGAMFVNPQPLPDFQIELDSGLFDSDSLVGAIPRSLLGDAVEVRLAFHALSSDGSEDALFTRDGSSAGAPITALLTQASSAPLLSGLGIALALLALFAIASSRLRSGRYGAVLGLVALMITSGAIIAYAVFGDPVAVDDPADAVPPDSRAEIVAAFAMATNSALGLRLDIEDFAFGTPTPTNTQTETPTSTPTSTPTETSTSTPTETSTSTPTETPTSTPTSTPMVSSSDYGPCDSCAAGETPVQITGLPGCFCSPMCDGVGGACPPPNESTAQAQCVLELTSGAGATQCALLCDVAMNNCPTGATCQDASGIGAPAGVGICTHPS